MTPARATPETTSQPAHANPRTTPNGPTPARALILFSVTALGETLDEIQQARVAAESRARNFERGTGTKPAPHLLATIDMLLAAEKQATKSLVRAWRKHPLAEWARSIPGVGEPSMARLIAAIGEPGERAMPSQLWQFCGHGDPDRSRPPAGATQAQILACGSKRAKTRLHLIVESIVQQNGESDKNGRSRARSPYRDVYDARKRVTEGRLHERACKRCGPAGRPAQPGSPWSDAHRHADAQRITGKRLLLDMWKVARAGQRTHDTQTADARAGEPAA